MRTTRRLRTHPVSLILGGLLLTGLVWGCDIFIPRPKPTSLYAIDVIAVDVCFGANDYCDGAAAVGAPDETSPWTGHFVSLGGGYIIATMERCFTNGEGADLLIYEVGGAGQGGVAEPFDVSVSADLVTWLPVAVEAKNDQGVTFTSVDISPLSDSYKYVKVVDQGLSGGRTPGADIDALEARYAARCTQTEPSTLQGLDVNATQGGSIDWSSVYDAGYRFVYVKATSGDDDEPTLRNPHLEWQAARAKAAGLAVGVYHFAYPEMNTPEDEAEYFLEVAGQYVREGYLRPALDIEEVNGPTSTGISLSDWISDWIEAVRAATDVEALLYTTSDYANNALEPWLADEETGYDLWIAHWRCESDRSPNCGAWDNRWVFWQYWAPTEPGITGCPGSRPVPGIAVPVDLDVFNGGMTRLFEYMITAVD